MKLKFMLTCVAGAEKIVKEELQCLLPQVSNVNVLKGKVLFCSDVFWTELLSLRCVDNIYAIIGEFSLGGHKKDLAELQNKIKKLNITGVVNKTKKQGRSIIVSASRSGKQTYSRFDIQNKIEKILLHQYDYILGNSDNHDLAFRFDLKDTHGIFSVQLTQANFKFRSNNYLSSKGGIRPAVAHCLVRLSLPQNNDIFYDPFCGAGTIAFERKNYKCKKIFASDISSNVLDITKKNLGADVITFQADACNTKMKKWSVDTVVSNIPWGKQVEVDNLKELYNNFIAELIRILKPKGKAILLTNQQDILIEAAVSKGMSIEKITEFSLHGLHPSVFLLTKE